MEGNDTKNCTHQYGGTDDRRFGEPMRWIGFYVAVASAVCAIFFAMDIIRSFRRRKLWVPPKFFVLNAAVLTILGVAVKLPNDINGKMPGLLDQLAKPSGILLLCVAMSHAMPSLGVMDNWELLSNMVALGILVVSTAANIWFQIHTGLITRYALLNTTCTIVMLLMFSMLVSYSLSVGSIKQHLEKQYQAKHREILGEVGDHRRALRSGEELRGYIKKYWLMALTSSPDFVLTTSGMSAACFYLYLALFTSSFSPLWSSMGIREKGCYVNSDYKWSTGLILPLQLLSFFVGFASVVTRVGQFTERGLVFAAFVKRLDAEKYMFQQLGKWKRDPLPFLVRKERVRIAAYHAKNLGVNLLILFQWIMTFLTRLLLAFGVFGENIAYFVLYVSHRFCLLVRGESVSGAEEAPSVEPLSYYVLSLEWLEERVRMSIAEEWKDYPDRWFAEGRARSPHHLWKLVTESPSPSSSSSSSSDEGASSRMQRLRTTSIHRAGVTSELLEDCWSLHLATLMCVIYAAFGGSHDLESLSRALDEGFLYFTLVDANNNGCNKKALHAAKMVWENLLFRREWLDVRLAKLPDGRRGIRETIRDLKVRAAAHVAEHEEEGLPEQLALEALAADSMSRITGALQLDGDRPWCLEEMRAEAAALVESCLEDLPTAIFRECSRGNYGQREDRVRLAAQVLGETWDILQILESRRLSSANPANV